MKKYIVVAALLTACGAAPGENTFDSAQEPLVQNYSAVNGFVQLPNPAQWFCHPTRFVASGGHSAQPILPWGVPAAGAIFGIGSAHTNAGFNEPNANARQDIQCDSWFNFHGNSSAGIVGSYSQVWAYQSGGPHFVSGSVGAYYQDSACWLSRLDSLSVTGETANLDTTSNQWLYTLNVSGFRQLGGTATCAWLGRTLSTRHWLTSTPSSWGLSALAPSQGVCLIMSVKGSLDDGQVHVTTHTTGKMMLKVTGTVSEAKAMCFSY